ncbi:PrsW family glutamic-type intramembrane protease [Brachybacterium sp. DNPG3]
MSQYPSSDPAHGRAAPGARPRPGASAAPSGAPSFQSQPRFVDYGTPRAYDTSVRPAGPLTAARFAPAQIDRPATAQPHSAWSTQTRRIEEIGQKPAAVPVVGVLVWIIAIVLGIALLVVLGLSFLEFVVFASSSPIWWPLSAFLALISLIVIIGTITVADRWDPQPKLLLLIAVLWGAAIAAGISYVLNTLNGVIFYTVTGNEELTDTLTAVISAPLVEESSKGAGLILLMLLARRYFNGPLDGLIYGTLIGGGFAFTENILYYTRQVEASGAESLFFLVGIRGVLNIFGHAIYTSLTGVVMGMIVRRWGTIPGALSFIVAVIPGMLLHGGWNLGASLITSTIVMLLLFAAEAVLSLIWLGLIVYLVFDESRLTRVRLGDYANQGWLTHEEVTMLATWKGRREGRRWAAQMGAKPLMKRFIRESADLASVRQRLLADGANPKVVAQEASLLQRLTDNRAALLHSHR